ncbi:MAG TPA: nickel-responsive transcriptional regulator NikR [Euryarchaeota archaeon]|nr:nickel-responsive transcriptional regulator NikR [Euryarchaeota archaeon]
MNDLVRFGVSMSPTLFDRFNRIIEKKGYTNRSEAIRDLIRDIIVQEEWKASEKEAIASLTIVYDHDVRGVNDKLTDLQHHFHGNVISSMHVHLDEHNCMEVLVLRGKTKDIKKISDILISSRGVKHGKLVMTSIGKGL